MPQVRFRIDLSSQHFEAYYQGVARAVIVTLNDGRKLQLPANVLRPFLLHDGIHGEFVLRFDDNHKLIDIQRATK